MIIATKFGKNFTLTLMFKVGIGTDSGFLTRARSDWQIGYGDLVDLLESLVMYLVHTTIQRCCKETQSTKTNMSNKTGLRRVRVRPT